jgi:hypothetical protein
VEDANATAPLPADLAVWRPSNGVWYILTSGEGGHQTSFDFQWGTADDIPVMGDFEGDGKTDFCIYRRSDSTWYIAYSSEMAGGDGIDLHATLFGNSCQPPYTSGCDIPTVADFDGDGKTDISLFRPSNGHWYRLNSSDGSFLDAGQFGQPGDDPTPADFDGDGRSDIAVWRNSEARFISANSSNGQFVYTPVGAAGDKPVCADYDGDGRADHAVFRSSNATWLMKKSLTGSETVQWGAAGDVTVPNDYDGDGKVDLAIWRGSASGMWSIKKSSNGQTRTDWWGAAGDIPVPANYRR